MKISDISINDTIITKDNIKGSVIQINSILYLNNIMSKKKNLPNYKLVLDNERSKDKIYNTITLLVMNSLLLHYLMMYLQNMMNIRKVDYMELLKKIILTMKIK